MLRGGYGVKTAVNMHR